jgi:Uma2 family endonuclease
MPETLEKRYTPADLLSMPDRKNYELVDGQLKERGMGGYSSFMNGRLLVLIGIYLEKNPVGVLFDSEASYQCFPGDNIRKPDVSFIEKSRLEGGMIPRGHIRIAPDLAVEVIWPPE